MDISQLEYFQTIAEIGNMTRAAELLHVAQPALSGSISRLEKQLGVQMFNRVKGKLELNEYGRELLIHSGTITREYREAIRIINEMKALNSTTIHFGILLFNYQSDMMAPFVYQHPEISLLPEVLTHCPGTPFALDRFDLVFTPLPETFENAEYLVTEKQEFALLVPEGHRFFKYSSIPFQELNGETVTLVGYKTHFSWFVEKTLRDNNIHLKKIVYVTEFSNLELLHENNCPTFFMPDMYRRNTPHTKTVRFSPPLYRENGFAYSTTKQMNKAARLFLDHALQFSEKNTLPGNSVG